MKFVLQSSDAPENYGFTRWVDPPDSVQEFIEYLQIKIFDLECKVNIYEEVSEGNKDDEDDDTSNAAGSQDEPCTIPYCNSPCHKKKGPAPPAPLQWVDTAEKTQHSLLRGGTATRTTLVLVTCCIVVFVVFFLNYLRHVRLVQNLFTVVCNWFCHATACVICISLPLYYDVNLIVHIM